ncbi:hypothetical protein MKW92_053733 [Papaver armeniacum]|nr:hypothetical protein MKW92_053733 [Papaver armeniacum]
MQSSKSSSVGSNEEFAEVLRSSWIRRLHLKPTTSSILKNKENPSSISPPPIAVNSPPSSNNGSLICNQTSISTDESRTPILVLFRLKKRATGSGKVTVLREDDDHLVDNCPENVNIKKMSSFSEKSLVNDRRGTPLSPFFRYWPDSKKKSTPPEEQTKRDEQCLAITGVSNDNQYCLRIGGINCHENCDNGGASRIFMGSVVFDVTYITYMCYLYNFTSSLHRHRLSFHQNMSNSSKSALIEHLQSPLSKFKLFYGRS